MPHARDTAHSAPHGLTAVGVYRSRLCQRGATVAVPDVDRGVGGRRERHGHPDFCGLGTGVNAHQFNRQLRGARRVAREANVAAVALAQAEQLIRQAGAEIAAAAVQGHGVGARLGHLRAADYDGAPARGSLPGLQH